MARPVYYSQCFRDLDERIRTGVVSQAEHWQKVADVRIDGERLGATRIRMRTPCAGEIRYEKKFEEAMILASVLAQKGLHMGAELRSWEVDGMPDFTGIVDDRELGLEIANVTESAHADAVLAALRNRLETIPVAPNRFVSISLPMVPLPPKLSVDNALRDIAVLAADPTVRLHERVPACASELARVAARITVAEMPTDVGYIEITSDAHSFNPEGMTPVALTELEDKKRCAERYRTGCPLWLMLYISDGNGIYMRSIDLFARIRPDVVPIERVFLTDGLRIADSADWPPRAA